MKRVAVKFLTLRNLHNSSEIHDENSITDMFDNCKVMGDKQVRQSQFRLKFLKQVDDLRLNRDIECRDRLIADDQIRI